jgi:hypothetical protein
LKVKLPLRLLRLKTLTTRPKTLNVPIRSIADVVDMTHAVERSANVRGVIPMTATVSLQAFGFGHGWHHFVSALEHGPEVLRWYFATLKSEDIFTNLMISRPGPACAQGFAAEFTGLPWIHRYLPPKPTATDVKSATANMKKLRVLASSIAANGYLNDDHGDIQGQFLVRGKDFRFLVITGNLRSSVL